MFLRRKPVKKNRLSVQSLPYIVDVQCIVIEVVVYRNVYAARRRFLPFDDVGKKAESEDHRNENPGNRCFLFEKREEAHHGFILSYISPLFLS